MNDDDRVEAEVEYRLETLAACVVEPEMDIEWAMAISHKHPKTLFEVTDVIWRMTEGKSSKGGGMSNVRVENLEEIHKLLNSLGPHLKQALMVACNRARVTMKKEIGIRLGKSQGHLNLSRATIKHSTHIFMMNQAVKDNLYGPAISAALIESGILEEIEQIGVERLSTVLLQQYRRFVVHGLPDLMP